MRIQKLASITAAALLAAGSFGVANAVSDQNVTVNATVVGAAVIDIPTDSQTINLGSSLSAPAVNEGSTGATQTSNDVSWYIDNGSASTANFEITADSTNTYPTTNVPALKETDGTNLIPIAISAKSCGATPTDITFASWNSDGQSTSGQVTGGNALLAACTANKGTITYTLGTPASSSPVPGSKTGVLYSDQINFLITQA